jgi:predicted phosphodiesterase
MTVKQLTADAHFVDAIRRGARNVDLQFAFPGSSISTIRRAAEAVRSGAGRSEPPDVQTSDVQTSDVPSLATSDPRPPLWRRLIDGAKAIAIGAPDTITPPDVPTTPERLATVTPEAAPVGIARRPETWFVLPDIHVPFHDEALLAKVCSAMRDIRPTGVVISGDFLDLFSLSRFAADSLYALRDVTLSGEYDAGNAVLDMIDAALPADCAKHFIYGNHEDRYWRELERGDRGKYGDALKSPTLALGLAERGYATQEHWKKAGIRLGDHLLVTHGSYTNEHTAKQHLLKWQTSVMFGHTHRVQTYVQGRRAAYNIGFLGDIRSKGFDYMDEPSRMQWTNGFAVVRIDEAGDYWAEVIQCHDGRFVCGGRFY